MINQAYRVEDGDTGVGFKKTDRLLNPFDTGLEAAYAENRVLTAKIAENNKLVGVIVWELS